MSKIIILTFILFSATYCNKFLAPVRDIKSVSAFTEGFLRGLTFFQNLPHQSGCLAEDVNIMNDVLDVAQLIKSLDKTNVLPVFEQVAAKGADIYTKVKSVVPLCAEWTHEMKDEGNKIVAYVSNTEYLTKFAMHTVISIEKIKERVTNGINLYKNGDFSHSGEAFGDLVRFVFFWDFKN
jgi:hypothetical protein